jgi:hypothetical protein
MANDFDYSGRMAIAIGDGPKHFLLTLASRYELPLKRGSPEMYTTAPSHPKWASRNVSKDRTYPLETSHRTISPSLTDGTYEPLPV